MAESYACHADVACHSGAEIPPTSAKSGRAASVQKSVERQRDGTRLFLNRTPSVVDYMQTPVRAA